MSLITISEFTAGQLPKVPMLEVKVHRKIGEALYIVGDKTDSIELSATLEVGPLKKFNISPEKFYRIVKPLATPSGIKLSTCQPTPIAPFEVLPFTVEDGGATADHSQARGSITAEDLKTFVDFSNFAARSNIGKLVSKVIYVSPKKASKFSECRIVGLKDVTGKKSHVTLFGKFADMVETEKVYEFQNLTVQNYKAPTDEFNRLGSTAATSIKETSEPVTELFESVLLGDGVIEGHILGYERLFHYKSCPLCLKKCDDVETCKACQKSLRGKELLFDFNVTLQVMDESDDDEVKLILCFRKVLTRELTLELEGLNTFLSQLIGQRCHIEYEKDKSRNDLVHAIKITLETKKKKKL